MSRLECAARGRPRGDAGTRPCPGAAQVPRQRVSRCWERRTGGLQHGLRDGRSPVCLFQVWYNQKGFHSLPSYLNHLNNLMLWRLLPPASDWRRYGNAIFHVL